MHPGEEQEDAPVTLFDRVNESDRVRLYREDERTKRMVFHGILSTDETTEERIAELFGGGKWKAQLMRRDPLTGKEVYGTSAFLEIPGAYRKPIGDLPGTVPPAPSGPSSGSAVQVSAAPSGVSVKDYLDNMIILRALEKPPESPWGAVIVAALPVLQEYFRAQMGQRVDPSATMVTAIQELKEAVQKQPGPASSAITDAVGAIKSLIGVKDMIEGRDDQPKGDPMWRVAEKALEALSAGRQAPVPQARPQEAAPELPSGLAPWQLMVLANKGRLLDAAARNADPGLIAGLVVTFAPDDQRGLLAELAQQPACETLLMDTLPELRQYPTWTGEFIAAVRDELFGTTDDVTGTDEGETVK